MQKGQARYWSLVGYTVPTTWELLGLVFNPSHSKIGVPVHAVYDEDFQLDRENKYILVFWAFDKTPNERLLPPSKADFASPTFDPAVLAKNNNQGFLGPYQPIVHYMKKQDFERLGTKPSPDKIPEWR